MPRKHKRIKVENGLYQAGEVFYACATPPGERQARWKNLGTVGIMRARRERDTFVAEVRSGGHAPVSRDLARIRLRDVAAEWLELREQLRDVGELRPRTVELDEIALRLHILPTLGARKITTLRPDDLIAWHQKQRLSGAAAWTIKGRWAVLTSLLTYMTRQHSVINPALALDRRERPKAGKAKVRVLNREEMRRILDATPKRYRTVVAVAIFSGLRVSEILGLIWDEIDFDGEVLRVRFQLSRQGERVPIKTPKGVRDVVLMPALATALRKHRLASPHSQGTDLVFASATGRTVGHRNVAQRGLDKATTKLGLDDVTFHTCRHTFASMLIDMGRTVDFVSEQLGHEDPSFTLRTYIHLFNAAKQRRAALDGLDAEYGDLLRGTGA